MFRKLSLCTGVRVEQQRKVFQRGLQKPGPDILVADEVCVTRIR